MIRTGNDFRIQIKTHLVNACSTLTVVNHSSPTFLRFESRAGFSCLIWFSPGVPAQTDGVKRLPLNQTASCSLAYKISPFGPPSGAVVAFILERMGRKSSDIYIIATIPKLVKILGKFIPLNCFRLSHLLNHDLKFKKNRSGT